VEKIMDALRRVKANESTIPLGGLNARETIMSYGGVCSVTSRYGDAV